MIFVGEHQKRVPGVYIEYIAHALWDYYLTLFADLHGSDKFALRHLHIGHSPF